MNSAIERVPALATAGVKQFINGPESFTPDNHFLLGEAPELKGFYVGAGFNSMGIASAGGAGMALAEWVLAGEPTMDLWPVDIRRFGPFNGNARWLKDRVKESLGLHYAMPWPNREFESARPLRRSPLYALLKARGACFGSRMGWERANWFAAPGEHPITEYSFGRQNWFRNSAREHLATRSSVALFDLSSFSKFLVKGRDAEAVLQALMANDVAVPTGRTVYSSMLNERGGIESDLTLTRIAADEYLIVTGSAQTTRDFSYIERAIPPDAHCTILDVTSMYAVLALMGPRARELLGKVTDADLSNAAFPFATSQLIDVGYARVRATRLTYVGELGWELYVPVEQAVAVYETLQAAGESPGLVDAGYYALESLRIEKGYRAWGRELTPDYHPLEAGIGFAVKLNSEHAFRGREALLMRRLEPLHRRLVIATLADPALTLWGGELILRDGEPVGHLSSAAYGHSIGSAVGMGYVRRDEAAVDEAFIHSGRYQIDIAGTLAEARVQLRAPYDPKGLRIRS
jgi:4-methylaminobutanoate oxidase (formaldehyde-forming)